jgi:ABC-type transport system substrate-binding protein
VVNISQVVAAELQKIGIHASIKALTLDAWEAAETGPVSKRQTSFSTGGCEGPDVSGYDHYIGSLGQFNLAGYAPAAVDKLVAAGLATTKPAQRFAIYSKLLQRVATDVPYVPLYVDDYTIAVDNGFVVPAFNQPAFQFDDWALQVKRAA